MTASTATPPLLGCKRTFTEFLTGSPYRPAQSNASTPTISAYADPSYLDAGPSFRAPIPSPYRSTRSQSPQSHPQSRAASPTQPYIAQSLPRVPPQFAQDASLVLIGLPGVGVSSLAVIAAKALRRRIIDSHEYFARLSGCTRTEYRSRYGNTQYYQQEAHVIRRICTDYEKNAIIAYGTISSRQEAGAHILRDFAKVHPVVYVSRHPSCIAKYLKTDEAHVRRLSRAAGSLYRVSSSVDFYNFSEEAPVVHDSASQPSRVTPFLTLKHLEQDFLRMLEHLFQGNAKLSNIVASFPLSSKPFKNREYTHALVLPLSLLASEAVAIEEIDTGVDAVELVVDTLAGHDKTSTFADLVDNISRQFARIRRATVLPIIYRVDAFPGAAQNSDTQNPSMRNAYLELVQLGARLCTDILVIDLHFDDQTLEAALDSRGASQAIGYFHAKQGWRHGWSGTEPVRICLRSVHLGFDAIRLSQPALHISDNNAAQEFVQRMKVSPDFNNRIPVCAYNTGPLGRMSQCFNSFLSPVTHEAISAEHVSDQTSGLITVREAHHALFSSFVLDKLKYYLIGKHLGHSLSPAMHNAAFNLIGMPHRYEICEMPSLRELPSIVGKPDFGGCSVALPFKVELIALLHSLDEHAEAIGAVNTLVPMRFEDGTHDAPKIGIHCRAGSVHGLHGINTDWIGIKNTIHSGLSPVNAVSAKTAALVLGAGGMARAAIYALIRLGVQTIFVWNRTHENALRVARHFKGRGLVDFDEQSPFLQTLPRSDTASKPILHILTSIDETWKYPTHLPSIIVAGVAASAQDQNSLVHPNITVPSSWLASPTGGVLLDLVYRPIVTALLRQVRRPESVSAGWVSRDMLDMLPEQAFAQFEVFTGRRAPRKVMREASMETYRRDWLPKLTGSDGEAVPHYLTRAGV